MTSASVYSTAGPETEVWREEIVASFDARLKRQGCGYTIVSVKLGDEYLRYFDQMLEDISAGDRRFPRSNAPAWQLLRSAAAEGILATSIAGRGAEGQPRVQIGVEAAMTGDLASVLFDGLVRRMDPRRISHHTTVDLLLDVGSTAVLRREVRRLAERYLLADEQDWYLGDGFSDLRDSFVEASLVTWMLMKEMIADEAVPARHALAHASAQGKPRRRCWLPRLASAYDALWGDRRLLH